MMSKLLRKCSQRHPRVQCISDAFWERFKVPQVPLLWCLRRKTTLVSPLSLSLSRSLSKLSPHSLPIPRRIKPQGFKHFIWGWSGSMNGYCAVSIPPCDAFIVEMPPEREAEESFSFTADCKLKHTKLLHHLQHNPPHLFFTGLHHPAAHRPKTSAQWLRLPNARWLFHQNNRGNLRRLYTDILRLLWGGFVPAPNTMSRHNIEVKYTALTHITALLALVLTCNAAIVQL